MKQSLRIAVAAVAMGMAATASAGYFEIGTELEDYNDSYKDADFVLPYMAVGGNPIEGSALRAEMKTSYRQMDNSSARPDDNRFRNDMTVGYTWNLGDFSFAPQYLLRQDFYGTKRSYEHRISPNMSYRLNDMFSFQLDGFVAPVQAKHEDARGTDSEKNNYLDYKHEFDIRVHTDLSENQRLTVSAFNEFGYKTKMDQVNNAGTVNRVEEWQLRVVYTHNFGDFSLTPFARFGLSRTETTVDGKKLDMNRHRVGMNGSYKLSSDLALVGETWYQTQTINNVAGEGLPKKNGMFYKVGVRYSF